MTQTQPLVSWRVSQAPLGRGHQTKGRGLPACCGNWRGFMEQAMSLGLGRMSRQAMSEQGTHSALCPGVFCPLMCVHIRV